MKICLTCTRQIPENSPDVCAVCVHSGPLAVRMQEFNLGEGDSPERGEQNAGREKQAS